MPVFTKDNVNVLYVHVPKAGGSAIEHHFEAEGFRMSYRDGRTGPGTDNYLRRCSPQHMHADLLKGLFRVGRFDAIFTVVREPLARFRSEYSMRNRRDLDLSAGAVDEWTKDVLRRYRKNPFVLDNHIRPQSEFILAGSVVHRLEDGLDALMRELNQRFDIGISETVRKVRTSVGQSGVQSSEVQLSADTERDLRAFYAEDFDRFGY